ncbi:MAG: putative immunity protein [Sphaerochaetaceae bacterium]
MRDFRFIAVHRGGKLTSSDHRLLMRWALDCTYHILPLIHKPLDDRIKEALDIAEVWSIGEVNTGEAMKAARRCHVIAKNTEDSLLKLFYRCVGQAVASAHMADHSLGPMYYGTKIIKATGSSVEDEQKWQLSRLEQLSKNLHELMVSSMDKRGKLR